MEPASIAALVVVALVGFSGGAESPCYQQDPIVGGLGLDGAGVIVPEGFNLIDGCLFDTSEQHETGVFYGDAYTPINRSETGLFVGGGF